MKIYSYTGHYPSLFKPYYDSHFAELVDAGHDLRIFSLGQQNEELTKKVKEYHLDDRTSQYYPRDLRSILRFAPLVLDRFSRAPGHLARTWRITDEFSGSTSEHLQHCLRALFLPRAAPDLNLVHGHYPMWLFRWLGRVYPDAPVGLYYYGGLPEEAGRFSDEEMSAIFDSVDCVFTPSRYAKREAASRGAETDRIRVLPLSLDVDEFPVEERSDYLSGGTLRLLSVGRLSAGKGQHLVLSALADLKDERPDIEFSYTVVGDGPRRSYLERLTSELGLATDVSLLGSLRFEEVRELYADSDVLVLSSYSTDQWTETQGTVIQEAMLMGNLVVTTRTGGVPESIPDCMTRFHVPPKDSEALGRAIADIYELEPSVFEEIACAGREWVKENFRVERFNERLLSTIEAYR